MSESAGASEAVEVVVVTGMSGSGKSTAIHALEDQGYYCIDNLPTALVGRFVDLCAEARAGMPRVGLGVDLRDAAYVDRWAAVRAGLEEEGHHVVVVFLDANDPTLVRRFSETRRPHPLGHGRDLTEAIGAERAALSAIQRDADLVIDTSSLNVHELGKRVRELVTTRSEKTGGLQITVKSFGYKHGTPVDADIAIDVRFLPNPHFVDALRPLTGLDQAVSDYVLDRDITREFLDKTMDWLEYLVPRFVDEGRPRLTVAVGCTGGHHRSVALAVEIARRLVRGGHGAIVRHRDVERKDT